MSKRNWEDWTSVAGTYWLRNSHQRWRSEGEMGKEREATAGGGRLAGHCETCY
jgi:hypothetical protein